jgi:aspartyl-tRNA(Asn)/glutamyl-tRNA(Gln) amidotransferase subunit C
MKITERQVRQIATLARLELRPEEIAEMAQDLTSILDHMEELSVVDVEGIAPMGSVREEPAPMRDDAVGADPLRLSPDRIAPAFAERFFLVPRLPALDAELVQGEGA